MYQGKRAAKRSVAKLSKKSIAVIGVLALVMVAVIGGTIAFLADSTPEITNTFTPGEMSSTITEEFNKTTKSSVVINNTGDTSAYIRVAVVGNWQDDEGNVVEAWTPAFTVGTDWIKGSDGYYYYTKPVAKGGSTTDLLGSSISGTDSSKPGLHLEVTVIQQSIQAEPTSAVVEAWGVTVSGTTISK